MLQHGSAIMDVLAVLGTSAAYFYSVLGIIPIWLMRTSRPISTLGPPPTSSLSSCSAGVTSSPLSPFCMFSQCYRRCGDHTCVIV